MIVKQIPAGKVATYGKIAKLAGLKSARQVGYYLHRNPDPTTIPCHRVVNAQGQLAANFAFGGAIGQAKKLRAEGHQVKNNRLTLTSANMLY